MNTTIFADIKKNLTVLHEYGQSTHQKALKLDTDPDGYILATENSYLRSFYKCDHGYIMTRITKTINYAVELIELIKADNQILHNKGLEDMSQQKIIGIITLIVYLLKSRAGLNRLAVQYASDVEYVKQVQSNIATINKSFDLFETYCNQVNIIDLTLTAPIIGHRIAIRDLFTNLKLRDL